nr:MAG TPA: hypothetical protein [Caudoviricetes sp.]
MLLLSSLLHFFKSSRSLIFYTLRYFTVTLNNKL